ncbi:hypothetical protein, partial [Roseateles sp. P5_E11]
MVKAIDHDNRSNPLTVEAFTCLLEKLAELFTTLRLRGIPKPNSHEPTCAQLGSDVLQEVIRLTASHP